MTDREERERLARLGPDQLADALLGLASRNEEAADLVETLLATPEENVQRFKRLLQGLKRRRRFVPWNEASAFAAELAGIIAALQEGVEAPRAGLDLVADFYRCDQAVFEHSDDSDGTIGDVFRDDARDTFVRYAAACDDKRWVADLVFDLYERDEYGARTEIVAHAAEFLPEQELRHLASRFWDRAEVEPSESYQGLHWWIGVELVAKGLGDPALFEKARVRWSPELSPAACTDIAAAYLAADDPEMALFWVSRVPPEEGFMAMERDHLLYKIHEQRGDREGMAKAAWRLFRAHRGAATLDLLLRAIGEEERDRVLAKEVQTILAGDRLSYGNAQFLVEAGTLAEAESYVLRHAGALDGAQYPVLVPIAERLEEGGFSLGATLLYRALLGSILNRAQSRYYHHGVRYLKKLDGLAPHVSDWGAPTPAQRLQPRTPGPAQAQAELLGGVRRVDLAVVPARPDRIRSLLRRADADLRVSDQAHGRGSEDDQGKA